VGGVGGGGGGVGGVGGAGGAGGGGSNVAATSSCQLYKSLEGSIWKGGLT
jgi:hypothetical protein